MIPRVISFNLILSLIASLFLPAARAAEPPPERVVITAAPLGRFGFGTGSGGPIWRSTIGHLVILSVQAGGPAASAGLRVGDEILAVDGLSVPGRSQAEVHAAMRNRDAGQAVVFRVAAEKGKAVAREVRVRPIVAAR